MTRQKYSEDSIESEDSNESSVQNLPIKVYSNHHLQQLIRQGYKVQDLDVRGDTYCAKSATELHPALKSLYSRKSLISLPGQRTDEKKIAIAIEGGGMRGCVAGGMVTALWHLGLQDSVDVVYGSSAGSLVGAYFVSKQLPYFGTEIYYDVLTSAGHEFIDAQAILRACGLGLLDFRADSFKRLFTDRIGKPVINLDYLLDNIVQQMKPLDWDTFWNQQTSGNLTLKVVASALLSKKSITMSSADANFQSLDDLTNCMRASMLLPGVSGDIVRLKGNQVSHNIEQTWWREFTSKTDFTIVKGSEPLADASIFEPLPYRSALQENCTDVIVLRTRADNVSVTAKMGMMEKMIMSR
jgi:predicted patatin/cPLA2 family phospholipase